MIEVEIEKTKEIGVRAEVGIAAGKIGKVESRGIEAKKEAVRDTKIILWNVTMKAMKNMGVPRMRIAPTKRKTNGKSAKVIEMIERVAEETQKKSLASHAPIEIGIDETPAKSDDEVESATIGTTTMMVILKVVGRTMDGEALTKIEDLWDGSMGLRHMVHLEEEGLAQDPVVIEDMVLGKDEVLKISLF